MLPPLAGKSTDIEASRNAEEDKHQEGGSTTMTSNVGFAHVIRSSDATNSTHWTNEKAQTRPSGTDGVNTSFIPPHSSYALSAVPDATQNYGTDPSGTIGRHHPKEVLRIERDWSDGEVCQFHQNYPMELEGRISPAEFSTLIAEVNQHLVHAYSQKAAVAENILAILTWHTSLFWWTSRFEKELCKVESVLETANKELWNQRGLNLLSPRKVALQYLEIEYEESSHQLLTILTGLCRYY